MKAIALLCVLLAITAASATNSRLRRKFAVQEQADVDTESMSEVVEAALADAEAEVDAEAPKNAEGLAAVQAVIDCRDSMPTDQSWETGSDFIDRAACKKCAVLAKKQLCGGQWNPIQVACDAMASGAETWDLAFAWGGLKELKLETLKPCPAGWKPTVVKMEVPTPKGWGDWVKPPQKKAPLKKKF